MQMLTAAAATGDGPVFTVRSEYRAYPRMVRARIGSGAVQLWGRMDSNDTWFALGTSFAASGVQMLQLPPQIKFTVSSWTSGVIDGWVDAL